MYFLFHRIPKEPLTGLLKSGQNSWKRDTLYLPSPWPDFQLCCGKCRLPLNEQENKLCHVSLGLPHSALICENMYSGQRFQALPRDPVSLQSSLVQTSKQTHVLKSPRCLTSTVRSQQYAWSTRCNDTGMAVGFHKCACTCTPNIFPRPTSY